MKRSLSPQEILEKHHIRSTDTRVQVLTHIHQSLHALSHNEIESFFKNRFDKVTLYRTLKTLWSKGLIHKISSENEPTRYATCQSNTCDHQHHEDNHIHFKCLQCEKVFCLSQVDVPQVHLPLGFKATSMQMMAEGCCDGCELS